MEEMRKRRMLMDEETLKQVSERFKEDHFATHIGCKIEKVEDGYAVCSLKLDERHLNAAGTVMGGVIFTLADFTFAVAANWNRVLTVSQSSSISFLGVAKGTRLLAEARLVKEGRTISYYSVDLIDDWGNIVAIATINGFKKES